ncbi:MAG: fused MFS/spermidine synthase [Saprospiraceae bacterium]|nr:fused MFS/spermidine synthase [Saprospiraceae bacterium]
MKAARINGFRTILSHLGDIHLETISTPFHPVLKLYLSRGEFKLVSRGAIYSYGLHYYHFVDAFRRLQLNDRAPQKALILGLGFGSIPRILEKKFGIEPSTDIVELDPDIIRLFEKYQHQVCSGRPGLILADGQEYMRRTQAQYDLICMDIFEDRTVPAVFEREAFLRDLSRALCPGGLLLYNRLNVTLEDQRANENFLRDFRRVFPDGYAVKCAYNWILVSEAPPLACEERP